jgi:hypothetical protein
MLRISALAFAAVALTATSAGAVSPAVRKACSADYAAYCSELKVGSAGLRSCMRSHRHQLTQGCLKALASSGEASPAEIAEFKREIGQK